jgi:hypothetical protein
MKEAMLRQLHPIHAVENNKLLSAVNNYIQGFAKNFRELSLIIITTTIITTIFMF